MKLVEQRPDQDSWRDEVIKNRDAGECYKIDSEGDLQHWYAKTGDPAAPSFATLKKLESEAQATEKRTWTDPSTGRTVRAEFLSYAFGKVKLRKEDGSVITVPMERLSDEDQKWIQDRAGEK